jgi:hypothetical protein
VRTEIEVAIPIIVYRERISKKQNLIEIRQVEAKWWRVIGDQTGDRGDLDRWQFFLALAILLIGAGALRSAWATRRDGFTIDEPWHITAGVAYISARVSST